MSFAQGIYDLNHCPECEVDLVAVPGEIDGDDPTDAGGEPNDCEYVEIDAPDAESPIIQVAVTAPRPMPSYERHAVIPFDAGWRTGGLVENRVGVSNKKLNVSDLEYYSDVAKNNKAKKEMVYVRCLHAPKAISA